MKTNTLLEFVTEWLNFYSYAESGFLEIYTMNCKVESLKKNEKLRIEN